MPDIYYPLDALLDGEEGSVELSLVVNVEGHAIAARTIKSSGIAELDQAAIDAASKWQFRPATREGQPVVGSVTIHLDWKLPLERVEDFRLSAPPLPDGVKPPKRVALISKYPSLSELGIVGFKFLLGPDGRVSEVEIAESSGVELIDRSAVEGAKSSWKFVPATLDGKPVEVWRTGVIAYDGRFYGNGRNTAQDKSKMRCYERPVDADVSLTVAARGDVYALPLNFEQLYIMRWVKVGSTGEIADVLLRIGGGLFRPNAALFAIMKQGTGYKTGANCWYYDPVTIDRPQSRPANEPKPTAGKLDQDGKICWEFAEPVDKKMAACSELLGPYGLRAFRARSYQYRAMTYAQQGDKESAARDYAASIKTYEGQWGDTWQYFAEHCFAHAVANVDLDVGLANCNEALRLKDDFGGVFNTRGLLYLRLGQYDKAIEDYNKALKIDPFFASAFYGRGIARLKSGDTERGNADLKAAERYERRVAERFATYGVTP
ncbi:MAG TPA: TonB family protein [Micropepsaceae bacterium]|nr:TonB family protein [Micropepsaceae bacterium]